MTIRRYDVEASPQRLSFRRSAAVFLAYIGLALLALAACWTARPGPPGHETADQKEEYGDAVGQQFARVLLGLVGPALCGGVVLYAGWMLVRGGDRFVLDRRRNMLTKNGRPLCPLDRVHRVVFRMGMSPTESRDGEGDPGTVTLDLALTDGREIRLDHARDEAAVAALAQQISAFLGVPVAAS